MTLAEQNRDGLAKPLRYFKRSEESLSTNGRQGKKELSASEGALVVGIAPKYGYGVFHLPILRLPPPRGGPLLPPVLRRMMANATKTTTTKHSSRATATPNGVIPLPLKAFCSESIAAMAAPV